VFLRRPTPWQGETSSDLNSSPFVSGSGSLGVSSAHTLIVPSGDAHQQSHRRKKKKSTLMGELSTAAASRKPCSLQRKRAFRVACSCFFWNTRNAISIANFWYYSTSPAGCTAKNTADCLSLAYLSCFTCLQGYASVCGSCQHTKKKGHPHLHRPSAGEI
jgi:hypothetical protein